jgi:hypothetical protein
MIFKVEIKENEYFWGGEVNSAPDMPISRDSKYSRDFRVDNHNQFMPMFISSKGRYVWSEKSFRVWIENGYLCFEGDREFQLYEGGKTLKDAYLHAMENHFPFDETRKQGKIMPTGLQSTPAPSKKISARHSDSTRPVNTSLTGVQASPTYASSSLATAPGSSRIDNRS